VTILSLPGNRNALSSNDLRSSRAVRSDFGNAGSNMGSVPSLSNIQSHMVYCQLSLIHFLAAKRLAEFSNAFSENVPQRRVGQASMRFEHHKLERSLRFRRIAAVIHRSILLSDGFKKRFASTF
jgi:hypothetical protein